jgi:hypothetical protein
MIARVVPGSVVVVAALTVPEFSVGAGDINGGGGRDGPPEPIPAKDPAARRLGTAPASMPELDGVRYAALFDASPVRAMKVSAAPAPRLAPVAAAVAPEPAAPLASPPELPPAPSLPPAEASALVRVAPVPVPAPPVAADAAMLESVAAPSLPEPERAASVAVPVETPSDAVAAAERGEPLGAVLSPQPTRLAAAPISAGGMSEARAPSMPAQVPAPSAPQPTPPAQLAAPVPAKSAGLSTPPAPRGAIDQVTTAQVIAARAAPPVAASPAAAAPAPARPASAPVSAPPAAAARPAAPAAASAVAAPAARAPITAPAPSPKPASAPGPAPAALAAVPKPAAATPAAAASSRYQQPVVTAKLLTRVDGKTAGMVDFQQTPEGLKVRLGSVVEVLANRYDPAQLARIRQSSAGDTFMPLAALQSQGIPISYDPVYDEFNVGLTDTRPKNAHKVHMDQISTPMSGR